VCSSNLAVGRRLRVDVISYGQTGSGKTHTMFGPPRSMGKVADDLADEGTDFSKDEHGFVLRSCLSIQYSADIAQLLNEPSPQPWKKFAPLLKKALITRLMTASRIAVASLGPSAFARTASYFSEYPLEF